MAGERKESQERLWRVGMGLASGRRGGSWGEGEKKGGEKGTRNGRDRRGGREWEVGSEGDLRQTLESSA